MSWFEIYRAKLRKLMDFMKPGGVWQPPPSSTRALLFSLQCFFPLHNENKDFLLFQ